MNVKAAIDKRRSCRAYKADPVSREQVEQVIEAGRRAPSACNKQPWRFAVVTDAERRRTIVDRGFRKGISMAWAADAPVLIVLGMKRSPVVHRAMPLLTRVDYPWIDIGIAGEHMVLQAVELGLGTCWIGWIHSRRLRSIVAWPGSVRPAAVLTLGWPADDDAPPPPTPRKDAAELVTWI